MPIEQLSNHEISQLETRIINSQGAGQTYTLSQVVSVKLSRQAPNFGGRDVTRLILAKSEENQDSLVTYKELWQSCYPSKTWKGQNSVREVMYILGKAVDYCLDNAQPVVTSIVVRKNSRTNSAKAKNNMFEAARAKRTLPTGMGPENFIGQEAHATLQMSPYNLP